MIILLKENLVNIKNVKKLSKRFICKNYNTIKKKDYSNVIAIYTKLKDKINQNNIKYFINLKYILSPTTGLNHIDEKIINDKKIKIISLRLFSKEIKKITSTSEFTIALILSASRKILEQSYFSKKSILNRYKYETYQFKNQTVGIIGYGRIGKYVAQKLSKLGFKVIINDVNKNIIQNKHFRSLKYLMANSNIISIHVNHTKKNENLIDKKYFKLCKNKPTLINTSRGELVNEKDLIKFLKKQKLSSAYLDVIRGEQAQYKKKKSELFKLNKTEKLFILPHLGGSTLDAMTETENLIIDNFINNYA